MNKIVSLLISLVTVAGIASAQISVRKSDAGKPVEMATLSMSWSWIYRIDDTYFLVMKSDNQFDDAYWLKMGVSKEECL